MAGESFYCLVCGTACPVVCYPTHCHMFARHNTSCAAHIPVFWAPQKPEDKALAKLLGWGNGPPGSLSQTGMVFVGQHGSTNTSLDQMLSNLSLNQAQATGVYSSYLPSNATTSHTIGTRSIPPSNQHPSAAVPQSFHPTKPRPSISEIEPGLFLGDIRCVSASFLQEKGITAVVTVRRSPIMDDFNSRMRKTIPLKDRLFLNAEDAHWQDLVQYFPGACDFIDRRLRPYLYINDDETDARESEQEKPTLPSHYQEPKKQHKVLVHCRKGISRSATIVAAYLMYKKRKPHDQVIDFIRRCRPQVNPNSGFQVQLQLWYKINFQLYSNNMFQVPCQEYSNLRMRMKLEELKR